MPAALYEGYFEPRFFKIFSGFEPDKSPADNHRRFHRRRRGERADFQSVLNRAQSENAFVRDIKIGQNGLCPRRQNKFIVPLFELFARLEVYDGYRLFFGIYIGYFVINLDRNSVARKETCGGLQSQLPSVGDNSAYIVGQTAVCIGNKSRTLENHYFRVFV